MSLCVIEITDDVEAFEATVMCYNPAFTPVGPGTQCGFGVFNVNLAPPTLSFSFNAQFEYEYLQDGFTFSDFCNVLGQSASLTFPTSLTSCCGVTASVSFTFSCDPAGITTTPTSVSGVVGASFTVTDLCVPSVICVEIPLLVDSAAALLAALYDEAATRVLLDPAVTLYDLSDFPPIDRAADVTLASAPPGTSVRFNDAQDFAHIIIGPDVELIIPMETIFNSSERVFYPTLADAVAGAGAGEVIMVGEGTQNLPDVLTIDKSLTIQGASAGSTSLVFASTVNVCLRAVSDDVSLKKLRLVSTFDPLAGEVDNRVVEVPVRAPAVPEVELYSNFTLQDCIVEGGRSSAFISVINPTITGSQFIHDSDQNAVQFEALGGEISVANNSFSGGSLSRTAMAFEAPSSSHFIRGTVSILDNDAESFSQFTSLNMQNMEDVDLLIQGNSMDHQSRSGDSIIFLPLGDFAQFNTLLIQDNAIVNPNDTRLAVYLDYNLGGASIPADGQVKVHNNTLEVAMPWGDPTDTVSPIAPVGFSAEVPFGLTLAAFDLAGNIII